MDVVIVVVFIALAVALVYVSVWSILSTNREPQLPRKDETAMWREVRDAMSRPGKETK